jgi:hypothetical protein
MSTQPRILNPQDSYTFSKYFELPYAIDDILADLDCTYSLENVDLPQAKYTLDLLTLQHKLERDILIADLKSEMARREILIAPVLLELCAYLHLRLRIEYPVNVSSWLKGTLDYYIAAEQNLLVIEAKRDNLDSGFTQLAAELIALDQWTKSTATILYGAVTTGRSWQFGLFDRQRRHITQDVKLFRVPEELTSLFQILIGVVQGSGK